MSKNYGNEKKDVKSDKNEKPLQRIRRSARIIFYQAPSHFHTEK